MGALYERHQHVMTYGNKKQYKSYSQRWKVIGYRCVWCNRAFIKNQSGYGKNKYTHYTQRQKRTKEMRYRYTKRAYNPSVKNWKFDKYTYKRKKYKKK